jgi:hypothetical protein
MVYANVRLVEHMVRRDVVFKSLCTTHRLLIANLWCDVNGEVASSGQSPRLT